MTIDFSKINLDLAEGIEDLYSSESLPALQSNRYQFPQLDEESIDQNSEDFVEIGGNWYRKPDLSLTEAGYNALHADTKAALKAVKGTFKFGDNKSDLYVLPRSARYVILARPIIHLLNKKTKEITVNDGGVRAGGGVVTVARLLLAIVIGDTLVCDENGDVQIFTLKLRSSTTKMIKDKAEKTTVYGLNDAVLKGIGKPKGWFLVLFSVCIDITVEIYTGADGSSVGAKFFLHPDLDVLPEDNAKLITDLVKTESFINLSRDPFGIARRGARPNDAAATAYPVASDIVDDLPDVDDIPF